MATEFKCYHCDTAVRENATLVHTEGDHGLWVLECSMCADCFKNFKSMLDKVKSQKSWTGWTALEQEADVLKKEVELLKKELQFLTHREKVCGELMSTDPQNEVVAVTPTVAKGGPTVCDPIRVHRSILINRSKVFKDTLTSKEFSQKYPGYDGRHKIHGPIPVPDIHLTEHMVNADTFHAFITFLHTAELSPEILKEHAPDLMRAGKEFKIELLTSKCEEYMAKNMTVSPAKTVNYFKVAQECGSTVVETAAKEQILSNPKDYDPTLLEEVIPHALTAFWQFVGVQAPKAAVQPAAAETNSDAGATTSGPYDPTRTRSANLQWPPYSAQRPLGQGICSCSVHPFAHGAHPVSQGTYEGHHGIYFNRAPVQPPVVNVVRPPTESPPPGA